MNALDNLSTIISSLTLDLSATSSQECDDATVSWYQSRFKMLIDDGVPYAINEYLAKCQNDERLNEKTKLTILSMGLSYINNI